MSLRSSRAKSGSIVGGGDDGSGPAILVLPLLWLRLGMARVRPPEFFPLIKQLLVVPLHPPNWIGSGHSMTTEDPWNMGGRLYHERGV